MVPSDVWRARTVVERPEPRVIVEPAARVEPEMRYCDFAFGVMVSVPMVRAAGEVPASLAVDDGRKEVLGP